MTDERRLVRREDVLALIDDLWREKRWLSIEDSAAKGELVIRLAALPDAALPQPATEPALDESVPDPDPEVERQAIEAEKIDYAARLAAQPSAEVERLRAALTNLRRHDMPDGPCWCSTVPNAANNFTHVRGCREARAALAGSDRP